MNPDSHLCLNCQKPLYDCYDLKYQADVIPRCCAQCDHPPVSLLDDIEETIRRIDLAVSKLSFEERKILHLSDADVAQLKDFIRQSRRIDFGKRNIKNGR